MPPSDNPVWQRAGASMAETMAAGASTARDIYDAVNGIMSTTWAINCLAWLENRRFAMYDLGTGMWRLTSAGKKLTKKAA